MTIKAVLFDLDGTLYDRDALLRRVVSDQYDAFRGDLQSVAKNDYVGRVIELDAYGYGDKPGLYASIAREWNLAPDLVPRLVQNFWDAYDIKCTLPDDARLTLETLQRRGLTLGVVTNGGVERQQRKLEVLGIASWFDAIVISEAEGVRKPDPEIFRRALARCSVNASEAIFVGDHPDADIGGAIQAGLHAVWKYVPYWTCHHPVPSILSLSELLPMCEVTSAPTG